jgi:putative transposase
MTRDEETTSLKEDTPTLDKVIEIDEARIRDHLGEPVRGAVEDTLNALRDAGARRLCNTGRYQRTQAWREPVTYSIGHAGHTRQAPGRL